MFAAVTAEQPATCQIRTYWEMQVTYLCNVISMYVISVILQCSRAYIHILSGPSQLYITGPQLPKEKGT